MVGWVISSLDILIEESENGRLLEISDDVVVVVKEEKCGSWRSLDFLLSCTCRAAAAQPPAEALYPYPRLQPKFKLLLLHFPIAIGGDEIAGKIFDMALATETGDGTVIFALGIDLFSLLGAPDDIRR